MISKQRLKKVGFNSFEDAVKYLSLKKSASGFSGWYILKKNNVEKDFFNLILEKIAEKRNGNKRS